MAKLASRNLSIEIRFLELDRDDWIQYEFIFLYKDQPIIQDKLIKRFNEHRPRRSPGAFPSNEEAADDGGSLIYTLQKALETDEMQYHETIEPDFIFAIYHDMAFPFMPSRYVRVYTSEKVQREERQREEDRAAAGGKLPDDVFTVIMMADVFNFGDEIAYCGEGPAIVMKVSRLDLQNFLEDYQREYKEFCHTWGISPANGNIPNND